MSTEMLKQTAYILLWAALAFYCFSGVTAQEEEREDCVDDGPEYNDSSCADDVPASTPTKVHTEVYRPRAHAPTVVYPVSTTAANAPHTWDGPCNFGVSLQSSVFLSAASFLCAYLIL